MSEQNRQNSHQISYFDYRLGGMRRVAGVVFDPEAQTRREALQAPSYPPQTNAAHRQRRPQNRTRSSFKTSFLEGGWGRGFASPQ